MILCRFRTTNRTTRDVPTLHLVMINLNAILQMSLDLGEMHTVLFSTTIKNIIFCHANIDSISMSSSVQHFSCIQCVTNATCKLRALLLRLTLLASFLRNS